MGDLKKYKEKENNRINMSYYLEISKVRYLNFNNN